MSGYWTPQISLIFSHPHFTHITLQKASNLPASPAKTAPLSQLHLPLAWENSGHYVLRVCQVPGVLETLAPEFGSGVFDQSPSSFCRSTTQTDLLQHVVLQNAHMVTPKMCSMLKGVSSTKLNVFINCKTCQSFKYANAHYTFPRGGRVCYHEVAKLFDCKSLVLESIIWDQKLDENIQRKASSHVDSHSSEFNSSLVTYFFLFLVPVDCDFSPDPKLLILP